MVRFYSLYSHYHVSHPWIGILKKAKQQAVIVHAVSQPSLPDVFVRLQEQHSVSWWY